MKKFISILCLFISTGTFSQVTRVEPPNWWVGMKDESVELLLYGKEISDLTAEVEYKGVKITKVTPAESKNYLFLELSIAENTQAGEVSIKLNSGRRTVHTFQYQMQNRNQNPASLTGFNSSDVIYLITPDRFSNGNPDNDIVKGMRETSLNRQEDYARHGGDLRGIIDHLDYLDEMGFTAIWSSPVLENNMKQQSYHGYAITDFYKIDPRFGTLDEYKELATKAKARGIKLIFDGVVNHSGSGYWWMEDLPFSDWINYQDSMRVTNHRRTVNEDLYAAQVDRELMTRGWFVPSMPDLNQTNPHMAKYLIQNSIWWIETLGLGGIRQDTYPYSDQSFLRDWTCSIMNEYPNFSIVGEEWSTNPLIVAYWQQGSAIKGRVQGCLNSTMDFPMQSNLVQALNEKESWGNGLVKLYDGLANDFIYANPQDLLVFGDNHDMDRIFTQLNEDVELTKMALTYLLTVRGIPQIYYGTEILMQNSAKRGDHGLIRSDFPGGWSGDDINGFTATGLNDHQKNTQEYLKALLNWRKDKKVIQTGKTLHFAPSDGVYVYFRYNESDIVMVILNKGQASRLNLLRFTEILGDKKNALNPFTGIYTDISGSIQIPAKSTLILEIK